MTIKFPLQRFTVFGDSMLPTLKRGQDILVLCWFYKLEKGDLVAVKKDAKDMIKRIKAIKEEEIFVLGDNEKVSLDSREFGWVKKEEIIGKVIWY